MSQSERPSTPNYVDVGYGNLPVSLKAGNINNISLELMTLGNGDKFNEFVFGSKRDFLTGSCNTEYLCDYYVYEEIQKDNEGLNLIYRPISLTNPFPGQDGTTRRRGSNWADDSLVYNYITYSRGAKEYDVYKKTPLYSIKLTPSLILKIREYNSNTNYSDYNLVCVNGEKCKSNFIRSSEFTQYFSGCRLNDTTTGCNRGEAW